MLVRELHSVMEFEVITSGQGPGPVVAFIHGALDRAAGMARLAREASAQAPCVRYDRRGYGDRWEHPGPFTIQGNVDDVQAIVGDRPCVLVGHSYGGHVALAAAARLGSQVIGVTTYESPLSWLEWWPHDTAGAMALARGPEDAAEAFMVAMIGSAAWNRLPERTRQHRRREGRALVGELSELRQQAPWEPESITCRVLCGVRGDAPPHQSRAATWMIDHIGKADVIPFDGASHGAHLTHARLFHQLLVAPHLTVREQ